MKLFIALALCGFAIVNSEDIPECIIKSLTECREESKKVMEGRLIWYAEQNKENSEKLCGALVAMVTCAEPKSKDYCEPDEAVTFRDYASSTLYATMGHLAKGPAQCIGKAKGTADECMCSHACDDA